MISIGRAAALDELYLENAGIEVKRGKIVIDTNMRTNVKGVYAIGDACSSPYDLAHTAMKEGIAAAENIAGRNVKMKYSAVPNCV